MKGEYVEGMFIKKGMKSPGFLALESMQKKKKYAQLLLLQLRFKPHCDTDMEAS